MRRDITMDGVTTIIAAVLIGAALVIGMRYVWKHFGRTFPAWGAKHYREISGAQGEDDNRHP